MKRTTATAPKNRPKARLAAAGPRSAQRTQPDVVHLVHELDVHRTELEAQNEELRAARTQSERVIERYAELFDFAPIGYLVLDAGGKIRESNLQGARTLGTTRMQLVGVPLASFVQDGSRSRIWTLIRDALCTQRQGRTINDCELTLCVPKCEPIEVRVTAAALSGDEPQVLLALVDVSAAKRAERHLRDESRRKDEFLAALSHELRNPLGPIRNGAEILRRLELLDEDARNAVAIIDRQTDHLTRIVDDLLDVSRITRSKIHLRREVLDARDVIQRTADDHRAEFEAGGLELDCRRGGEELWVDADPTRLAQIVGNLLANALKFTPRGGHVEVRAASVDERARISVRDDGVGIAPEVRNRLFEPFVQGPQSLDRTRGGLGLGLATVKGLVELHGGEVAVASEGVGRGLVFVVHLPLASAPKGSVHPQPASGTYIKRQVLIVEDNADAAEALKYLLAMDGHDVRVAHDGAGGLALARRSPPDIVFCDLGLPEMDGYAVARAMRSDGSLRDVCLIALSGYAAEQDRARALEAGFDGHLSKPPDLAELERVLAGPPGGHAALA